MASARICRRSAVFSRGLFCRRCAGRLVQPLPRGRSFAGGGLDLRRLRASLHRRAGCGAPSTAAAHAAVGIRRVAAGKSRPAVISGGGTGVRIGVVGTRAADRDSGCGDVRRGRRRRDADDLGDRRCAVVAGARGLVAAVGRCARPVAVTACGAADHAGDAGRLCLVVSTSTRRIGTGNDPRGIPEWYVSGSRRSPFSDFHRGAAGMGGSTMAAVWRARRHDAGRQHHRAVHARPRASRRRIGRRDGGAPLLDKSSHHAAMDVGRVGGRRLRRGVRAGLDPRGRQVQ